MKSKYFLQGVVVALLVFALDQFHKWVMLELVHIGERPPIPVTPFFNLILTWNRGISFGISNTPDSPVFFWLALAGIIIFALLIWLTRVKTVLPSIAIGLVIGGALGNVLDRMRFGAVADFFDFYVGSWHWPAFNIADSAVCIGAVLLAVDSFRKDGKRAP